MTRAMIRLRHFACLLAIVLLWSGARVGLAQGLTPLQLAELQSVSSAILSDDGRYVAFTRSVPTDPREANEPAADHLFLLDTERDSTWALFTEASVSSVSFRPEHGTITFLASREEDDEQKNKGDEQENGGNVLYEMTVDGNLSRLLAHETSISSYTWAPDGDRVAFIAEEDLDRPDSELPYEPEFFEEHVPHQRGFIHDVTRGEDPQPINVEGTLYLMEWSPEGERLAISEAPTPHVDDYYMYQSVKVVAAEGGNVIAEIDNEGKLGQITWSPDGERLALRAGDDIHDPIDGRIMVVDAEGGTPQNIAPEFEGKFEHIDWADGDTIHFIASEGVERLFGTIRSDGSELTRLLETGGPIWTDFEVAPDRSTVFTAHTPQHPSEVYLMRDGGEAPTRVTKSNAWLDDVEMGRQEVVRYEARDGEYEIEGLLVHPVDGTAEEERVPLIVVVHGGPESHYSNGWITTYSQPGQVGAARGYAVFYPNYRGSTGRGLDFAMSSQSDLAGKEFDDIVDGVDHLIAEGIADSSRVGVTGGSYGGYATAWMSTYYSERFAAGVMNVGISNNLSKWGTSDIPEELYLVHARTRIWEAWDEMLERSPVYHVDNAQTPLLVAHGKEDTRVHPGQSLELYRHLKVRNPDLPVRLVLYPEEGHGYARSTARFDYNLRMMRWFDAFLKGGGSMPPSRLNLEELEEKAATPTIP